MSEVFSGILETDPKGFGFIRTLSLTLSPSPKDVFVPPGIITQNRLRPGVLVEGTGAPGDKGNTRVATITRINGMEPEAWKSVQDFGTLQVIQPRDRISLTGREQNTSMRVVDLFCPIGRGQRGLIVAPPKAGKTRLLQELAHAISMHNDDITMIVLLIDERPEEVTDMRRSIRGEVFASSSDSAGAQHIRLAQLVLEYAKRKVEAGKHIVLLLDSLTRMGRAFNVQQKSSGRTLSGGVDIRALEIPKRIFGAARNIEHGGSLTILATALIETNSRMDELIFQEFKGTGNMELVLSRELSDERIFPAIDLNKSGTRNEELLFGNDTMRHQTLRRSLARIQPREAMKQVLELIQRFPDNALLLDQVKG
ncbi:MAG TPA: transcription termination factor Rho [bacterium]|nr:transcription termination factor Rho [bacterium]HNL27178.1 transcription termination factor Rho [bacterium]HNO11910.1 transcription termination factor Rho [bacterium]